MDFGLGYILIFVSSTIKNDLHILNDAMQLVFFTFSLNIAMPNMTEIGTKAKGTNPDAAVLDLVPLNNSFLDSVGYCIHPLTAVFTIPFYRFDIPFWRRDLGCITRVSR